MPLSGMQNVADRIASTRKDLTQRGVTLWSDLQERGSEWINDLQHRGEKLVDAGQRALDEVETTVLTRAHGLLGWAYGATGERSDALRRGRDFIAERLDGADDDGEDDAQLADDDVAIDEAATDAEDTDETEVFAAKTAPFEGYDELNVKKILEQLEGLEPAILREVIAYEDANKGRKTVIAAAERLLGA
jgi:hypothetical protein